MDQAPLAALEDLDDEEHGEAAPDAAQEGVGDGQRHHAAVTRRGDPALRAAVKCEETENEDKSSEADERHRMARQRLALGQLLLEVFCLDVLKFEIHWVRICRAWVQA